MCSSRSTTCACNARQRSASWEASRLLRSPSALLNASGESWGVQNQASEKADKRVSAWFVHLYFCACVHVCIVRLVCPMCACVRVCVSMCVLCECVLERYKGKRSRGLTKPRLPGLVDGTELLTQLLLLFLEALNVLKHCRQQQGKPQGAAGQTQE